MEEELTIQDVAAHTGLSVHTLRYYERIGLLEPVSRATSGHRRYTTGDLTWITFLQCLRATGMSIQQMLAFSFLRRQGDITMPERLAFLEAHRQQVLEHIHDLEKNLAAIEKKMQNVGSTLANKREGTADNQVLIPSSFPIAAQNKEKEIAPSS